MEQLEKLMRSAGYHAFTPMQSTLLPPLLSRKDIIAETGSAQGKSFTLAAAALLPLIDPRKKRIPPKALILLPSKEEVLQYQGLFQRLTRDIPEDKVHVSCLGIKETPRNEKKSLKKQPDILCATPDRLIDHIRRDNLSLNGIRHLYVDFPNDEDTQGFERDISFILNKGRRLKQFCLLYPAQPPKLEETLSGIKHPLAFTPSDWENKEKSNHKESPMEDLEILKGKIDDLTKQIRLEEDPDEMIAYKKAFKRTVPFMMRGYVAGFLLKQYVEGKGSRSRKPRKAASRPQDRPDDITLFVGVGKNRKVFPRDIIGLFISEAKLEREDIGNIRILDSYSFVGIHKDKAAQVIQKLNGTPFRGRELKVDYSKDKKSE